MSIPSTLILKLLVRSGLVSNTPHPNSNFSSSCITVALEVLSPYLRPAIICCLFDILDKLIVFICVMRLILIPIFYTKDLSFWSFSQVLALLWAPNVLMAPNVLFVFCFFSILSVHHMDILKGQPPRDRVIGTILDPHPTAYG